ncbi:MAG TPA: adenylate/guanylate cyclase domain-containing protein [Vicinamibacterales bacterium]
MLRKAATVLGLGLGAAVFVLAIAAAGALDRAELWLYDWRMRITASADDIHPDIVVVLIDDQTLRDAEPFFGRWPWPRVAHTYLFNFLARAPAKVVAFDIGIWETDVTTHNIGGTEWTGQESDAAFAEAIRASGNVVLLADVTYAAADEQVNKDVEVPDPGYRLDAPLAPRPSIVAPIAELTAASAALGHNFLAIDHDGVARRLAPFVSVDDLHVPSLGTAAALLAGGYRPDEISFDGRILRIRDKAVPTVPTLVHSSANPADEHEQLSMMIRWNAPAEIESYPTYAANQVIAAEDAILRGEKPGLDSAVFRDKIVFIGVTAAGTHDVFQTPFGTGTMPGAQLHATMADNILSGRFVGLAPGWTRIVSVVTLGVVAAALPIAWSYTLGAISTVVLGALLALTSVALFRDGTWINLAQPGAVMALSLFAGTAYRYFVEDRQKRVVQKLFGRYVSRDVYQQLIEHPERAELGGNRRDMTVLFSDIRGFTTVTEKGDPEALVAQLNEYFSRMVDIVFRHHGTVDKFVGDMVMALFGAPLDDPDHADDAVAAAVDMVRELEELNRTWAAEGRAVLDIGIGVNSGEMIAGNIGSSSIMSYTVIGDNVNLGSRLESLNKNYDSRIIISEATRARLKTAYDIRPLGDVVVKGKTRPVEIFQVVVPSPLPEKEAQT